MKTQSKPTKEEIQQWEEEAKKQTMESISDFIYKLMDNKHSYDSICDAITLGAVATAYAMNRHKNGGITGFQAGFVMWGFIRHWNHEHNKVGLRLVNYDDFLYPQYVDNHQKTISKDVWKNLQREAKTLIEENKDSKYVSSDVYKHWVTIVNGRVPFGYVVKED